MHEEFKVESCDVIWNMQKQCHEITIVSKQGDRIFITDLGEGYQTKLHKAQQERIRLAEKYESLLGILDYIDVCTTAASGGFPEEMKKALNKIHEVCEEVFKGDIE